MKTFTKEEKSWIMFDWANSVYATIIMAAVFPIYFSNVASAHGFSGDVYWGYATSIATFIVAICAPVLGSIGDFKGYKKKMFAFFLIVGISFTALMAITDNPMIMLIGYACSYIGFAGNGLFYDSFLTDVTTKEKMDKVSSYGFAMGYIGGSTIAFLISIALIMFGENFGIDGTLAVKLSVMLTCIWWGGFSLPMLFNVKQKHYVEKPKGNVIKNIFTKVKETLRTILSNKAMRIFIIAYFFYIDGVGTVIHMATSYGSTLGLDGNMMIIALLVTQLVAVPCSILFSHISSKIGTIKMLLSGITIYILVCAVGFYMGFTLEPHQKTYEQGFTTVLNMSKDELPQEVLDRIKAKSMPLLSSAERTEDFEKAISDVIEEYPQHETAIVNAKAAMSAYLADENMASDYDGALAFSTSMFWLLSVLVGTSQGGMQALSRSFFGKIIPAERSNEFFGFFDIFGKFAAVIGPALYAMFAAATGRSSMGILSISLLFIVGWMILFTNRKRLTELGNSGVQ